MTPGDGFGVLPLIARGEELLRLAQADGIITPAEQAEHDSYVALAAALVKHTTQFPMASTAAEESAQYLAQQEARSAREREEAALTVLRAAGRVLGQLGLALLKAELAKGLEAAHLPASLTPLVQVVQTAAEGAAAQVVADVTGG